MSQELFNITSEDLRDIYLKTIDEPHFRSIRLTNLEIEFVAYIARYCVDRFCEKNRLKKKADDASH